MDLLLMQIKNLRKSKGLTQKQFADKLKLSHEHYNSIEKGRNNVTIELLNKIAKTFKLHLIITFIDKQKT